MDNGNKKITLFWYSQTGNSFSCAERAANLLVENGYEVILSYVLNPADNGYDAIQLYERAIKNKDPFDLLIFDLVIPNGIGGRDALMIISLMDPNVKAILVSGHTSHKVMENYERYGFLDVLKKPFEIETLAKLLKKHCSSEISV